MGSLTPLSNRITETQNQPQQLRRLAAQRHLYRLAKRVVAVQAALAGPAPLAWSIAVALAPWAQPWSALWGLSAALLDASLLDRWQKSLTRRAAQIQELFDCAVLELNWNPLVAGHAPDPEEVNRAARRHGSEESSTPLADWYPAAVGRVPIHVGRLICQRSNLWWEADIRRRYVWWLVGLIAAVAALVLLVGFVGDLTIRALVLTVLAPLAPALLFGIRQYHAHREAISRVDRFKAHLQEVWDRGRNGALGKEDLAREGRRLQDVIFQHRATTPLIFDFVYRRLRSARQQEMEAGAEELVREARDVNAS